MTENKPNEVKSSGSGREGNNNYRWRGHRNNNGNNNSRYRNTRTNTKFEGQSSDLKGYVYDYTRYLNLDQFTNTTEAIANYVGSNYNYGSDLVSKIQGYEGETFKEPVWTEACEKG